MITTLVSFKRFWQKSLDGKLKLTIPFVAPDGLYEFNVLPFQLKNSGLFLRIGSWFIKRVRVTPHWWHTGVQPDCFKRASGTSWLEINVPHKAGLMLKPITQVCYLWQNVGHRNINICGIGCITIYASLHKDANCKNVFNNIYYAPNLSEKVLMGGGVCLLTSDWTYHVIFFFSLWFLIIMWFSN